MIIVLVKFNLIFIIGCDELVEVVLMIICEFDVLVFLMNEFKVIYLKYMLVVDVKVCIDEYYFGIVMLGFGVG